MAKVFQIHIKQLQRIVEFNGQDALLDTLEKNGIHHEYQCRSGYCGACRVTLLSGQVSYPTPPLAFLNAQDLLLCCCQVESDLEIEW